MTGFGGMTFWVTRHHYCSDARLQLDFLDTTSRFVLRKIETLTTMLQRNRFLSQKICAPWFDHQYFSFASLSDCVSAAHKNFSDAETLCASAQAN